MGSWENEGWKWELVWRSLGAREESNLYNLLTSLNRYKLEQSSEDYWSWNPANNGLFPTKKAYSRTVDPGGEEGDEIQIKAYKNLWGSSVPRRIQCIVWKILKQRVPTKIELRKISIIPPNGDVLCTLCGDKEEDSNHLFFKCSFSTNIWNIIHVWENIVMVAHEDPFVHFLQHGDMFESTLYGNIASSIWIGTVWLIWKTRNEKLFENIKTDARKLIEEIKARTWSWLVAKIPKAKNLQFLSWRSNLTTEIKSMV